MYYYIVDTNRLTQRQYERVQSQLYSSVSLYHIAGEIVRVTGIRTVKQLVETAFFHQAKTIVAVGSDESLNEVIDQVAGRDIVIGYIPLIASELSEMLGITDIASACKNLAMRRVEQFDLGSANEKKFVTKLTFGLQLNRPSGFNFFGMKIINQLLNNPSFEVRFTVDGKYTATTEVMGGIVINSRGNNCNHSLGSPTDGLLDVVLVPKLSRVELIKHRNNILNGCFETLPGASVMHLEQLEIVTPNLPVRLGGAELTQTPLSIEIKPKAVKLIVGRERKL